MSDLSSARHRVRRGPSPQGDDQQPHKHSQPCPHLSCAGLSTQELVPEHIRYACTVSPLAL